MKEKKAFEDAMEYIRRAAESDCPEALSDLGQIFEIGGIRNPKTDRVIKLIKKNHEKAIEYYKEAADKGCEQAQNYLGSFAFNHEKNIQKAYNYF